MEPMSQESSTVKQDQDTNIGFAIYLSCVAIAGAVIMMLGYKYHWGFWGWFGGGILVFSGVGGLGGMMVTGGAGIVECPRCSHPIDVLHISEHRVLPCPSCHTYLEGAEEMKPVQDDYIAAFPVFEAPVPPQIQWPEGCPVCREPATGTVTVEGTSTAGTMASLMLPISFHKVDKLKAPCCSKHKDGVGLHLAGGGSIVSFRSYGYWQEFCAINQVELNYRSPEKES